MELAVGTSTTCHAQQNSWAFPDLQIISAAMVILSVASALMASVINAQNS
ncbi:MAG: hypothetical protein K9K82_13195 [Desulfobacteraceae bacterium]|nr:hypothetical protein [Desulfobacteraceae bacterium]